MSAGGKDFREGKKRGGGRESSSLYANLAVEERFVFGLKQGC